MIRNACLGIVLMASLALAQEEGAPGCHTRESEHPAPSSNAVVFWNAVADNSIAVVGGKSPQQGSIESAIVQIAVYDAVNAICGYPFTLYAVKPDVRVPALPEAAVAAAAHDVLVALYPAQTTALDQQYDRYLDAIPGHHEGKLNGIAVGQQTAAGILALRANDGRNAGPGWTPPAAWTRRLATHATGLPACGHAVDSFCDPLDYDQSIAVPGPAAASAR